MMWLQYVSDVGSVAVEQVEEATIHNSLRRMSRAILVFEKENGQGPASVLPEEEKEGSETAGSPEAHDDNTDDDTDDELTSENKKGYSFANALSSLGNTIVITLAAIGYPVAVLPYYRAASTTEYVNLPWHSATATDIDRCTSAPLTTQLFLASPV